MPSYWANDMVRTGGSVNYWRFSDPRVDALAIAQGKELNVQKRKQTIDELQDLLVDLAPFLPLYDRITFQFYSCQLRNMRPPIPHPDFEGIQEAWIDSSGC
jgi:ABC-type transport system substrate-binding protein